MFCHHKLFQIVKGFLSTQYTYHKPFHKSIMQYQEAVRSLNCLQSNTLTLDGGRISAEKKLENMVNYIHRSGLTLEDIDKLSIIHISGTKGKGSTSAYCESILRHEGYKTAFFSSPHLVEVRERFRINGKPISKDLFTSKFWHVYNKMLETKESYDDLMPPYFAFLTVLSCHIFLEEKVDVTILEVGIGGVYDSTNFIRRPVACGVTSLGLDHTNILGTDIASIAWNKAGIFKEGVPAITVKQPPEAMEVLLERSIELKNPLYVTSCIDEISEDVQLGINGNKQIINASLAIQLCKVWKQRHSRINSSSLPLSNKEYCGIPLIEVDQLTDIEKQGLKNCIWYGRNQTVHRPGITYYLDGAHTLESVQQCVDWFNESTLKEAKTIKGTVVKLLVFNLTSGRGRDVTTLLSEIQQCHFNGAVFTPNLAYSAIDPNQSDNLYKAVSEEEGNQHCESIRTEWETLISESDKPKSKTPHGETLQNGTLKEAQQFGGSQNGHGEGLDIKKTYCLTHVFPCISSALFWATQGRDNCITVEENNVTPDIPSDFSKASHIQILITGSLHLVGGALSIIMPNLND